MSVQGVRPREASGAAIFVNARANMCSSVGFLNCAGAYTVDTPVASSPRESELNDVPGRDFVTRTSLCPIVSWSQVTWDIACQSVALQSALFDTVAILMYAFSIGIVRKLARLFVPKPGDSQVFM